MDHAFAEAKKLEYLNITLKISIGKIYCDPVLHRSVNTILL